MSETPKTGPVHEYDFLPESISLDFIAKDASVTDRLIPTGELTFRRLKRETGSYTALPDADTEIAHGLGVTPEELTLVPLSTGVIGYGLESARSATSITVRANVSGVDMKYSLIA